MRPFFLALIFGATLLSSADAQNHTHTAINGTAWDSVRHRPLNGALITILGESVSTLTDSNGSFHFDAVVSGRRVFHAQHPMLDSVGLNAISSTVEVHGSEATAYLYVPGFLALRRLACGNVPLGENNGFVYGTIRDAGSRRTLSGATVSATWVDLGLRQDSTSTPKRYRFESESDSVGSYALCNVPRDVILRVGARTQSVASGNVDVSVPASLGLVRRDLLVGAGGVGTIFGSVQTADGRARTDARVVLGDSIEFRTSSSGEFRIPRVPAGTHQIEVLSIGAAPTLQIVDVFPNDTARVEIVIRQVQELAERRVIGTRTRQYVLSELEERRKSGFGRFIDSTRFEKVLYTYTPFQEMPGVIANPGRHQLSFPGNCTPDLFVDGVDQRVTSGKEVIDALQFLDPKSVAMLEVYLHPTDVPFVFIRHTGARGGIACGAIVITTKRELP